ncbi:MAG: hypothetical protein HY692_09965 [Cyanobacteria bacterium NC_groundwater_1444_Ag_S-0.65um_54_12]|nr:hypothetical protein [Cyanobacteria bacterium NC_groundwater_1444_Ag_S-0.65um_54_12]
MLEFYAEKVIEGSITMDEAMARSFAAVRNASKNPRTAHAVHDLPAGTVERKVLLSFELRNEEALKVLQALDDCSNKLPEGVSRAEALVALAEHYLLVNSKIPE